jgi:hypothetical protein
VAQGGLGWVGAYLTAAALVSLIAVLLIGETRRTDLRRTVSSEEIGAAFQQAPPA